MPELNHSTMKPTPPSSSPISANKKCKFSIFSGQNPWIIFDSFLSLLTHVQMHHQMLSVPFSKCSQNLVTSHHLHCNYLVQVNHCLSPRHCNDSWLTFPASTFTPSYPSQSTQRDPLKMYITSLLKSYSLFPLHLDKNPTPYHYKCPSCSLNTMCLFLPKSICIFLFLHSEILFLWISA